MTINKSQGQTLADPVFGHGQLYDSWSYSPDITRHLKEGSYNEALCNNESVDKNVPVLPVSQSTKSNRDFNHAVLYSCDALQLDLSQQEKVIKFVDAMDLRPISMITEYGTEKNSLNH